MSRTIITNVATYFLLILALSAGTSGQSLVNKPSTAPPDVRVKVTATDVGGKALQLEVTTTNSGSSPIYIMTDPQRSDRSRGFYIDEDRDDPSVIFCTAQLYPPAPFNMYFNGTHVHLVLLKPGESHLEKVSVALPVRSTEPPFAASPGTHQLTAQTKRVGAAIGVLPHTDELDRLLARKMEHDSITGLESVGGRPLYQLQQVVRAAPVEIQHLQLLSATDTLAHESGHADPPKQQ